MSINIGDKFEFPFSFTQDDVVNFANASGDFNPIHLDKDYASKTIFKRTIIHGFLGASVFSKIFGTIYPGSGTIYLKQDLTFYHPMFTNTNYNAVLTILSKDVTKNRALVKTEILDETYKVVITGEALIKHQIII